MNEEIKEMLQDVKDSIEYNEREHTGSLKDKWIKEMYNYITNLQQDLDKANDIIQKDRQFYKCRMDEYVDLKKENERLKEKVNNLEMFKYNIPRDKTKTISTITKSYKNEYEVYKSRLEKVSNKLDSMFANGEENKILDDLLELDKIVKGDKQ